MATAHLPTDKPELFTLLTRQRRPIALDDYRNWIEATAEHTRRDLRVKERQGWYVGWNLLRHFYWTAQTKNLHGYGPQSSELLAAWLGGL